ncbi:NAD-dependent epimerase/dehydratase family protein [Nonomuraea helvata]|uniref:NAD-dependent epimerase/dehydratase family protein n=1 Tax=Nonomuraea helvata TaxID=37484 RepID=A0ABV5SCU4_9ACTN
MAPHDSTPRALITGGLGFIGGWLARRLLAEGYRVTALDMSGVPGSTAEALGLVRHPAFTVVRGGVTDPGTYADLDDDFEVIVHAAAILGVDRVTRQSIETLDVNIRGTQLCLEFSRRQRLLRRFLLMSTSEVYGPRAGNAYEVSSLSLQTDSMRWSYAASKAACEFLGMAYHHEQGVPVTIVRPFNVYGPHRYSPNAMTTFIARALRGEDLDIRGDGNQRRSWCYISDFVHGLLRCIERPQAVGATFNLGNDAATLSVTELARRIVELSGSASCLRTVDGGGPDVLDRSPSIEKAGRLLGYRPVVGLDAGIARVITSMRASELACSAA